MKINIQNIKQGISEFEENVKVEFLADTIAQYYPENFVINAQIDKFEHDVRIKIHFGSEGHFICDRCLKEYTREVEGQHEQIYSTGSSKVTDEEEIRQLPADTKEIDISPLIAEAVFLNHPVKMLCRADCKGICPDCGADLNEEACRCASGQTDPRWEELRKLIK